MSVDLMEWMKLVLGSSFVATITTGAFTYFGSVRAKRRNARNAALTAALSLERYARDCRSTMCEARSALEEVDRMQSYDPIHSVALPKFVFPAGIEWKAISHRTEVELREFQEWVPSAQRFIRAGEFEDPFGYADDVEFKSAEVGLRALNLARRTRRRNGVPKWIPPVEDAELESDLARRFTEIENRRKRFAEQHASSRT
ncbi:hypothetical protein [Ralstonia pseudosolanacearum]|uniref:Putative transmembrane protein n=1 Tax=Ralstonia solanacearum TaxID=305 RepID=A0A0S4WXZ5_RALSL|nr:MULTISPECIES: hypothetical protein [Ralstonia]UZF13958.1 hypothetical protein LH706_13060 [Ralstonia solanacearum]UZF24071.1 hypothetical protein LGV80_13215 [Ralstonia sp. RS642]UZF29029.1 hypothetical protein LGV82_12735 [Ralstonia sp. RS650]CUV56442.1 putative transmembrane protein [Ralstonia solanacearum]